MSNHLDHKAFLQAVLLLALFLSGLMMQEIHQYHNPAQVVKECRTVDQHYHPDSDAHHCDLCDFKITCFPAFAAIAIHTNNIIDNWFANDQQVILKDLLSYSSRGPPMS